MEKYSGIARSKLIASVQKETEDGKDDNGKKPFYEEGMQRVWDRAAKETEGG